MKVFIVAAAGVIAAQALIGAGIAQNASHGKQVFEVWCAGCHEPLPGRSFEPPAGTYVLHQRYNGRIPEALEQNDLKPDYIRQMVRNGKNMMPQTRKTELSDQDLADLVEYLSKSK
jgi:mono/diheme cytochrome c family protein